MAVVLMPLLLTLNKHLTTKTTLVKETSSNQQLRHHSDNNSGTF